MSGNQPELFKQREVRMNRGPLLASYLLKVLTIHKDGLTRKVLKTKYNLTDRECRLARQFSGGRILSGQRGYKATEFATLDEIKTAAGALERQARVMMSSASELGSVMHGRVPAAAPETVQDPAPDGR